MISANSSSSPISISSSGARMWLIQSLALKSAPKIGDGGNGLPGVALKSRK